MSIFKKKKRIMSLKTSLFYSPNFDLKKRKSKNIKFLIFHYTGMKNDNLALNRLCSFKSKVSSHYFINKKGKLIQLVPDSYIAWHAGVSGWKNFKSLNNSSIGIEISNPGHRFNYSNFNQKQIKTIIRLSKYLIKKYKIKKTCILGHSDIAPERKKDPGEKFPWRKLFIKKIGIWHNIDKQHLQKLRKLKLNALEKKSFELRLKLIGYCINKPKKNSIINIVTKAFQRRFRPELINGIADKECLIIAKKLVIS
jgi:N-acetylmuramoyl-L-alanine amidase